MSAFSLPQPVKSWEEAHKIAEAIRARGGKIVTTNGCFDVLHAGHVTYLAYARSLGDCLIVGINSDSSVKKLKGPGRPIHNAQDRALVLSQLKSVDAVCVFEEDTPVDWLKKIKPHYHVKGGDYAVDSMPETTTLKTWGGEVKLAPFVEGHSTSNILARSKKI